jgi:hypothetical protein
MLSLVLVFALVSSLSSSFLVFPAPLLKNAAFADLMGAPATKDTITAGLPPKDDNDDGDDEDDEDSDDIPSAKDASVTTDIITIKEGSNDDDENNQKKQDSNNSPKAINLGKCSIPGHEHDIFTDECKPITPLSGTQIPECPAGQECRLNSFGNVKADNTATALNFGDFGGSANALAVQNIEVTQKDGDSEPATLPPPLLPPASTTIPTSIPTPINPTPSQDQSKASLCPHEPEEELSGDVKADNTATALNFGDFGCSANALTVQNIEVTQK